MTTALKLDAVSRSFDARQVLKGVSFAVTGGRMTGFAGASGAGKTTTMRIILGVLDADEGELTWNGSPLTREARQRFGYLPEARGLYPKMTVADQVVYLGQLHGLDRAAAVRRTAELLDRLGLGEGADDKLEKLSLGNQQRAQFAAALVHDPDLLVLAEPFSGLDPLAVDIVVQVLRERLSTDHALPRYQLLVDGDAGWLHDVPGVTLLGLESWATAWKSRNT